MNREEAIKHLETYSTTLGSGQTAQAQHEEAKRIAIKALEQEPTKEEMALLQKWRDNRGISMEEFEDAMNTLDQGPCGNAIDRAEAIKVASGYCHPANIANELAKLPSVNPQTCGDAIDRKLVCAFIDGLISDDREREKGLEYIRNMPPVNPQPCEDAISRQAALGCCRNEWEEEVEIRLKSLPPVTPQPKIGRWVENDRGISICSCCGKDKYEDIDGSIYDDVWFPNYCPNCGAKMQEGEE